MTRCALEIDLRTLTDLELLSRTERLARQARPRAAGMNGQRLLGGVLDRSLHVGHAPRPDNTQRPHLIDAPIAGVHFNRGVVAQNLACEQTPQIGLNSLALRVHEEGLLPTARKQERLNLIIPEAQWWGK